MAETYLITAKTVAEAIAVAKREYEDADHEISYEIVKMEKKGLFGLLGARDAQIKVTVSKVVSVQSELGSLVADIKNLKTVTDRGSSGTPAVQQEKPQQPQKQQQNQPKAEKQQQNQNQNQNQKQQKQQKGEAQQQNQQPQKQQQSQQKQQNQPKAEKQQQNQPKAEKQQNQQKQQNQPKAEKQQNQNQQKQQNQPKQNQPKTEKPVEKPAEAPVKAEEPAEKTAFGEAQTPYRSALGNQATPRKRNRQKKAAQHPAEEDLSAAVTVSAPVGLTDFVSEGSESGFGSGAGANTSSGGRMNNDIRKKNRGQKPAEAEKPAETPALSTTVVPASEVPAQSRRNRGRRGGRGPVQRTDSDAAAQKYDIAESDEDYARLNALVAEAEEIFDAKKTEEPVREERRREAITEAEMNYALDFVNTLLGNMRLDAHAVRAECPEGEEFDVTEEATVYPKIDIVGEETGILIGHHGETLDSIQYLANLCALRRTKSRDGDYVKIVVDIENYRQKREDTLRTLARRMAARAVRYRRNVFLEPMNAYERRIIHSELQNYDGVSTHSVGTDRDRKIIVTYEGPDKQPDRRRGEEKAAEVQNAQNQQSQQGQKKSRSRRGRGGDKSAQNDPAAEVTANTGAGAAEPKEPRERRRPRKPTKMSLEELTDWLPDAGDSAEEADDTLNVMSGLREQAADAASEAADEIEETSDAAVKAEEAVREAEAKFEAKAAALLDALGALADDEDK
ncbi:MAG: Jag N-terminal domain-containing protein [Clostridiales bacterium]|nr:Jag N-terminal domain-containing protein [Clostridiales bacterium]